MSLVNGYPVILLELMVKINKMLAVKKIKLKKLKEMNAETEKRRFITESFPPNFVRKYATSVIYLNILHI